MALLSNKHLCDVYLFCLQVFSVVVVFGKMHTFEDISFTIEPSDTIVTKDSSAMLHCSTNAKSVPVIEWWRNGNPIDNFDNKQILANGSLFFLNIHSSMPGSFDEGMYQCSAHLKGIGTIVSRSAKLQLASLPKFEKEPRDITLLKGQTAYFPCLVEAFPSASVRWLKNEQPLQIDTLRMTILPSGALELDEVTKFDAGSYRCNTTNTEQSKLSTHGVLTINTNYDGENRVTLPNFIATPPKSVAVTQGKSLTLDCVANGTPKPTITWLKDGATIDMAYLDSRFSIMGSGSLHVEKPEEGDSGSYMCRAENHMDSIDSSVNVAVQVPPSFTKKPKSQYANAKEDVEFNCEVYGKPQPAIQWLKNGEKLVSSQYFQIVNGKNLKVLGLVMTDSGIYQCTAANALGSIQASAELIVLENEAKDSLSINSFTTTSQPNKYLEGHNMKDAPSEPQDVKAIIVSTRFATLSWKEPERTNGNIFAYSVYYRESSSQRERVINTTRLKLEDINIQGLLPSTKYIFRVVAYNQHGPGHSSPELMIETQPEVQVPGVPQNIEATPVNATTIYVQWQPPPSNGLVQYYKVFYTEEGATDEHNETTVDLKYALVSLKKFTEYNIWVVAYNQNGAGGSSSEVSCKTFADAPSDTPLNVTLEAASSSSIIVRWEAPPKEAQHGIITGYKIRYKLKSSRRADIVTTDGNRRLYALTGLEKSSQYNVKISALSANGSGPFTEWITGETFNTDLNESKVPDQPASLRARPSSTSILVNWAPPRNQNIMVRGYTLGWGVGIPDVYTEALDGKQRHFKIENLSPSSEYVISLRAYNQIGDGRPVYETVKTHVETTPEPLSHMGPPLGLKAIVLSATTVVLYWTDTTLSRNQIVTDNRFYMIRYSSYSTSSPKYKYYNSTNLNCMIDDLKPNTQYEFSVKIVKGRRESTWSMSVLNTTQESAPSSPPRDLTIVPSEEDSTHINLHWQPPKQPNGHITGYVIFYTTDNTQKDRDWVVEGVVGDKMTTVLKGLLVDTTYYFKIQARNSKGYGPLSSEISFETMPGTAHLHGSALHDPKGLTNNMLYIIIACVCGGTLFIVVITTVFICKRRRRHLLSSRSKSCGKGSAAKSKSLGKEIVPPDLWIHHDQMELKSIDKNNMTVTPIQRNSQELGEEPLLSALDKKKSAYLDPLDDNLKNVEHYVKCQIRATPLKIPLDVQKPLISSSSSISTPSGSSSQSSDCAANLSRPMYPRTQYNISRSHNIGELGQTGSTVDLNVPLPPMPNIHTPGCAFENPQNAIIADSCQVVSFTPPSVIPVPVIVEQNTGTLTKRIPGHPLRSFTVPAPPPQSAPTTPLPKHLDGTLQKHSLPHSSIPPPHPVSTLVTHHQPLIKPQQEHQVAKPMTAQVHASWSTEKLNQEVANLEGLMKDLNAMRASEFEC